MFMAKKRKKGKAKTAVEDYKAKLVGATSDFVGKELGNLAGWLRGVGHIGRHVKKMATAYALLISGVTIVLYGLARLVLTLAPTLQDWIAYVIVGIAAIILGYIYKNL